jgi:hypothetical protein
MSEVGSKSKTVIVIRQITCHLGNQSRKQLHITIRNRGGFMQIFGFKTKWKNKKTKFVLIEYSIIQPFENHRIYNEDLMRKVGNKMMNETSMMYPHTQHICNQPHKQTMCDCQSAWKAVPLFNRGNVVCIFREIHTGRVLLDVGIKA